MSRNVFLASILFVSVFFLSACSIENESISTETPITIKPNIEISDTPLNFEVPSYSKSEAITIPYTNPLPENAEVVVNNENVTVLLYTSAVKMTIRRDTRIMINQGVSDGKIVFQKTSDGIKRYGFMNDDFSFLTDAVYTMVFPFENGNAVVQMQSGYGVIDLNGNEIMPCVLDKQPAFMKNVIKVPYEKIDNISRYNCYNRMSGEFAYSLKEVFNTDTGEHIFFKELPNGEEEYMDITEEIIGNDITVYRDKELGSFGYKNVFGDIVIPPQFVYAYEFNNGLARVRDKSQYGYIDKSGKLVIPYQYTAASDFDDGVAKVTLDGKERYILENGEQLHNMDFSITKSYHEGLAAVIRVGETKWEYIDEDGNSAFPGQFTRAGNFSHGYAPVLDKYLRNYYIDKSGYPAFGGMLFEYAQDINEDGYSIMEIDTAVNVWDEERRGYATASAWLYYLIIVKN